jgi:hypothetical protein
MFGSFSKFCGGNVEPSRFVKLGTDDTVTHAGAGENPWGISQPSTRRLALSGWDDGYAGIDGSPAINIYGPGDDSCLLELVGTVSIGNYIKASTDGKGVAASSDKDKVGAIALQAGVSGDIIKVKPIRFDLAV